MTVLLHKTVKLHERSRISRLWKVGHVTSYVVAGVCGVMNCYLLFKLCQMFSGRCILDPAQLVFAAPPRPVEVTTTPRPDNETTTESQIEWEPTPLKLDLDESGFHVWSYCQQPLSVPLIAAVVAIVWAAMFCVCSGGKAKIGFSKPWRVLVPALVFSLVFAALTAHNFLETDRGLQAFCRQFSNLTNTTSCTSSMDAYIDHAELSPSASVQTCRAACAGAFVAWLVAAALLLARCLSGADFQPSSTSVRLHNKTVEKPPPLRRPRKRPNRRTISVEQTPPNNQDNGPRQAPSSPRDGSSTGPQTEESPALLNRPQSIVRFQDEVNQNDIELKSK